MVLASLVEERGAVGKEVVWDAAVEEATAQEERVLAVAVA